MQGYDEAFAHIYSMRWTFFARDLAPRIQAFYEATSVGADNKQVLDLACGTGDLAVYLLEQGYDVTGLDLSPSMLRHASEKAASYVAQGKARFVQGDAADFTLDERFGLVISTFDALNHLPGMDHLKGCFASTFASLVPDGWFIFDLNTRHGLERWAGMNVQEDDDLVLITRGVVVHEQGRAYTQISGFHKQENGLYKRFCEVVYNSMFNMAEVDAALRQTGFRRVYFAQARALDTPVDDPEHYGRIFILAQK